MQTLTYPQQAAPSGSPAEVLTYSYDRAGRATDVATTLGAAYVRNATYSALDQPQVQTLGNTVQQTWTYAGALQRLDHLQVGTATTPTSLADRTYGYDPVGNVSGLTNNKTAEAQTFGYDQRDRLTSWTSSGGPNPVANQSYTYDPLGNLTSKAGISYTYGPTNNGPHQARTVNGVAYTYDANGNLSSSRSSYTWNAENQLVSALSSNIVNGPLYTYVYDGDGERVQQISNDRQAKIVKDTTYLGGLVEVDRQTGNIQATRTFYAFGGQTVAQASVTGSVRTLTYLHSDHLGSVSLATGSSGTLLSNQDYDPWGAVRSGTISETALNYTGQHKDDSGLLYYHARYYDPTLARFVSADSIVPGSSSGAGGFGSIGQDSQATTRGLTVDFHETGLSSALNGENAFTQGKGFWFQLSSDDQGKAKAPWGPGNPQALNRYSYVLNNPLRYTDPTGHYQEYHGIMGTTYVFTNEETAWIANTLNSAAGVGDLIALMTLKFGGLPVTLLAGIAAGLLAIGSGWLGNIAAAGHHFEYTDIPGSMPGVFIMLNVEGRAEWAAEFGSYWNWSVYGKPLGSGRDPRPIGPPSPPPAPAPCSTSGPCAYPLPPHS